MSGAFFSAQGIGGGTVQRGVQPFNGATTVTVNHSLGYAPDVNIRDSDGNNIVGLVSHTSVSSFTVSFNVPLSGTIHYT